MPGQMLLGDSLKLTPNVGICFASFTLMGAVKSLHAF